MRSLVPDGLTSADNHGASEREPLYKGRYFSQLLASVARVAANKSTAVKAAFLAPPAARESLHTAVSDLSKLDKSKLDKSALDGATEAERLWRKIAASLEVDLSAPIRTSRCGNPACPTPGQRARLVCGGCAKTASPQRYCSATPCQRGASVTLAGLLTVRSRLEATQARLRQVADG